MAYIGMADIVMVHIAVRESVGERVGAGVGEGVGLRDAAKACGEVGSWALVQVRTVASMLRTREQQRCPMSAAPHSSPSCTRRSWAHVRAFACVRACVRLRGSMRACMRVRVRVRVCPRPCMLIREHMPDRTAR